MGFLATVQRPGGTTAAKSGFLSSVILSQDPERAEKLAELDRQAAKAEEEAKKANSFTGIVANTGRGIIEMAKGIAHEIGKPIARQAANLGLATKFLDKEEYERAAREGVEVPGYGKTKPVGVSGDSAADLKDIAGTALETASLITPSTRAPALLRGTGLLKRNAIEGASLGGGSGATYGAGHEVQDPNSTVGSVLSEAAMGALIGAGIGLPAGVAPTLLRSTRRDGFLSSVALPETAPQTAPNASRRSAPAKVAPMAEPAGNTVVLKPVESTGPARRSGLAASVEEQAVSQKLTTDFGDLPQYNQVNLAEQARKASTLIETDLPRAKRIALGQERPPADMLPESVFVAMEERALKSGDVDTLRDLATRSSLSTEATAMGQRIRALGERGADSPVPTIQHIREVRAQTFERRAGKKLDVAKRETAASIKESIKAHQPTKQTWDDFISSIECGY